MNLEERTALFVDLGTISSSVTDDLQRKLVALRQENQIPDVILSVQHLPEVSFGVDEPNNKFSDEFLQTLGSDATPQQIEHALAQKGISFSRANRGGGATYFAPGQLVYYPIVDHAVITGKSLDLAAYKSKVYRVMFETLQSLGISGINYGSHLTDEDLTGRKNRRDVWLQKDGKSYKLGSKGLKCEKNVAYYGFSLYIDQKGIDNFGLINPCGYEHDHVSVTSAEAVLGRKVAHTDVHDTVRSLLKHHFGYESLKVVNFDYLSSLMNEALREEVVA